MLAMAVQKAQREPVAPMDTRTARMMRSYIDNISDRYEATLFLMVVQDMKNHGLMLTTGNKPDVSEDNWKAFIADSALRALFHVSVIDARDWNGRPRQAFFRLKLTAAKHVEQQRKSLLTAASTSEKHGSI